MAVLNESFQDPEQAFARGTFKRIEPHTIDLPTCKQPPNPAHANFWLDRMPPDVRTLLTTDLHNAFFAPLQLHIALAHTTNSKLPRPKLHTSSQHYATLLSKAEDAGMLYWSIVPTEHPTFTPFANVIQMTLFAMSKTEHRNRFISWPRIPNAVIPDPPHTSLPDPSLFESIVTQGSNASAFYLDLHNMFHNITLPVALAHLFPMPPIPISALPTPLLHKLHRRLPLHNVPLSILLRPFQATMPMGFKCSVFIAHTFADSCLKQAFHLFKSSSLAPNPLHQPTEMEREYAPFLVSRSVPLILHVIDDIAAIVFDWPDPALLCW